MRMKILKYLIYPGVLAADTENSVATTNIPLSTSQLCFPLGLTSLWAVVKELPPPFQVTLY